MSERHKFINIMTPFVVRHMTKSEFEEIEPILNQKNPSSTFYQQRMEIEKRMSSETIISHDGFFYHRGQFGGWLKGMPDPGPRQFNAQVTCGPKDALIGEALSKPVVEKSSGYVPDKFTADDLKSALEDLWRS